MYSKTYLKKNPNNPDIFFAKVRCPFNEYIKIKHDIYG